MRNPESRELLQSQIRQYVPFAPEVYGALQVTSVAALVLHGLQLILFIKFDLFTLAMLNILSLFTWITVFFLNRLDQIALALGLASVQIFFHAFVSVSLLGLDYGYQNYFWIGLVCVVCHPKLMYKPVIAICISTMCIFVFYQFTISVPAFSDRLDSLKGDIYLLNFMFGGLAVMTALFLFRKSFDRQHKKLANFAITDELTGLNNRRFMVDYFARQKPNRRKSQDLHCLAMCDIDNFKRINDRYGHAFGDKVLLAISEKLKLHLRQEDMVCRWGGEEFLILMTNCNLHFATRLISEIQQSFEKKFSLDEVDDLQITLSFGLAESSEAPAYENLIKVVDNYLFEAKLSGRSSIVSKLNPAAGMANP